MGTPEVRAAALLAELPPYIWDGRTLPVPVEAIADSHCGLLVREVAPEDLRQVPGAPALQSGEGLSGLLLADDAEIWVNAEEALQWPGRRRFTIGHELGHWRLHRPHGSLFCRTATVTGAAGAVPDIEDEASRFAAALLFPPELVRAHHAELRGDFTALCERFGASKRAMRRAICNAVRRPAIAGLPVELFLEDDEGYAAWRAGHRHDGFVLNEDLADPGCSRLHRASCSYLDMPLHEGQPRTQDPKLCGVGRNLLLEISPAAKPCGRCAP